ADAITTKDTNYGRQIRRRRHERSHQLRGLFQFNCPADETGSWRKRTSFWPLLRYAKNFRALYEQGTHYSRSFRSKRNPRLACASVTCEALFHAVPLSGLVPHPAPACCSNRPTLGCHAAIPFSTS
ncbi:unnamed protein product, partial [Rangifer tarandus platyrhynchus]